MAEAEMLESALRNAANKLIEIIDTASKPEEIESLGKLKTAIHRILYDQLTQRPVARLRS